MERTAVIKLGLRNININGHQKVQVKSRAKDNGAIISSLTVHGCNSTALTVTVSTAKFTTILILNHYLERVGLSTESQVKVALVTETDFSSSKHDKIITIISAYLNITFITLAW